MFEDIKQKRTAPETGKLLLSEPFLFDMNFKRSVVLLTEHNEQEGSLGFILNRPMDLTLADIIPECHDRIRLYNGGPVQKDTLHFIHRDNELLTPGQEIAEGLFWGGDINEVLDLLRAGRLDESKYRFFLGYSGWGSKQLEEEMESDSWLILPSELSLRSLIFGKEGDEMWKEILQHMGGSYKLLSTLPDSPLLN